MSITHRLARSADRIMAMRPPDFVIGGHARPYLLRWYVTPWSHLYRDVPDEAKTRLQLVISRLPGIYLHKFLRDDDDRALHDHPWANCSWVLDGQYREHSIAAGGIHHRIMRRAGALVLRRGRTAHRVELINEQPCVSLFFHGLRLRNWGFHCPKGWVPWKQFVAPDDRGAVGRGCE